MSVAKKSLPNRGGKISSNISKSESKLLEAKNENSNKSPTSPSKQTYSAQHEAPQRCYQPNSRTWQNVPNMETSSFPFCSVTPLYNVSSRMTNNGQNIPRGNATPGPNIHYSCPCSSLPPPVPPCTPKDDLWDLQFCRWWGWNWIRKREEMMNHKNAEMMKQQKAEVNKKSNNINPPADEQPKSNRSRSKNRRLRKKKDDFFTWCNKLFKRRHSTKKLIHDEKKQLQELYDTPCSSITFNKCPCPVNDWECRSLNLEGNYDCYCSSIRQTSMSTVVVQNKTRRQACKHRMRKHQSWVCEKTESSSSDDCCPCISVCPQRGESSTEESVKYLSMRMACVKSSDGEDNFECPCMKLNHKENKRNSPRTICCTCKNKKKQDSFHCPCMIKFVCEKPIRCCNCNKLPKQNCECNCREQNIAKPRDCICELYRQKTNEFNCRAPLPCKSLPGCRNCPSGQKRKVPQFRRRSPKVNVNQVCVSVPECRRPKRKFITDCQCEKKQEYILYCPCQHWPRKKFKKSEKPKKVYCCRCCRNKMFAEHQIESTRKTKKSKSEKNLKLTSNKSVNCPCNSSKSMFENLNVPNRPIVTGCKINNQKYNVTETQPLKTGTCLNSGVNSPIREYIEDSFICNAMKYGVSRALDKGLYTSPLTGKFYTLNTTVFPTNGVLHKSNLPNPFAVTDKIFTINPIKSPVADEEHKVLLSAVCEAIMSSRCSEKGSNKRYTLTLPEPPFLSPNEYRSSINPQLSKNTKPNMYESFCKNDDRYFPYQNSNEVGVHDYASEETQSSSCSSKLGDFNFKNFTAPNIIPPSTSGTSTHNNAIISSSLILPPKPSVPIAEISKKAFKYKNETVQENEYSKLFETVNTNPSFVKKDKLQNSINQQLGNLNKTERRKNRNDGVKKLPTTNISENSNNKTTRTQEPEPSVFHKLSTETSVYDSNEGFVCFENNSTHNIEVSLSRTGIDLPESLIPFNLPNNWLNTPKSTVTGVFSSICNTEASKTIKKSSKSNSQQFKNYDVLFSSDNPNFSEQLSNLPYNFRPIPPPCVVNNRPSYLSLVLEELPLSNVTEETQTNMFTVRPALISKDHSEKELQCTSLKKEDVFYDKSQQVRSVKDAAINCDLTKMKLVAHSVTHNTPTENEEGSEKEIGSQYFNDNDYKSHRRTLSPLKNPTPSSGNFENNIYQNSNETCLYLYHEPQNLSLKPSPHKFENSIQQRESQNFIHILNNTDFINTKTSEKTLSVIKRISEESLSELPPYTKNLESSVLDISSLRSLLQDTVMNSKCTESNYLPEVVNASISPLYLNYPWNQTQRLPVDSTTSPFKIKYTKTRGSERSITENYTNRKVSKRESPFSMFCSPVESKAPTPGLSTMDGKGSLSRMERKVVVAKPKKLKMREKRWRY